jgi:GNAT superfamily N-acetyltransferase
MATIRAATMADAAGIAVVQRAGWFAAYEGIVPHDIIEQVQAPDGGARVRERLRGRPWQRNLVACEEAGEIVGYASYGPERDVLGGQWPATPTEAGTAGQIGELYALYVHPDWWSTGTGRALMTDVLAKTAALCYGEVVLWVLEKNARARRFYALAGFEPDGAVNILEGLGGVPELRYRRTVQLST